MDPQLLARLQQMMGGGAQPPPMGGGMPAGMGGWSGPSPGGNAQFNGSPWPQTPTNAQPMPAPPGGGFNMPMGAPSGGWPLGLAQQSGRPPGDDRPRQPPPGGGRPPPIGTNPPKPNQPPKPVPGSKPKPAAKPADDPFSSQQAMQKYLMDRGVPLSDYTSAFYGGNDVMMRLYDSVRGRPPTNAAPTPKPDDRPRQPQPDGRPPSNPGQRGAPSGFPGQLEGPNPVITPMFRHLFSNQDVARYGIRQPNYLNNAYFDDTGLHWQTGVQKKWWEPNDPIVWGKDRKV